MRPRSAVTRALEAIARLQTRAPWRFLLVILAVTLGTGWLASGLKLRTGFESLLPEGRPSVIELDRVAKKTAGVSTLFLVVQGGEGARSEDLRKAGDALVPALRALGPPYVGSCEDGLHDGYRFLLPRAGLFADLDKLQKLRADVDARFEYEVTKAAGLQFDDDPPPPIDEASLKKTFGGERSDRYPDGYYQSADGKTLVVAIRSKVLASDVPEATALLKKVGAIVEEARLAQIHPTLTVGYAGDLYSGLAEYRAVMEDLTDVGYAGGALLCGVVLLYYLRVRTLAAMMLTIGVGLSWTFGLTRLAIGHLNIATGFLFTIVAGNGINFGILYMARYLEVRRRGLPLEEAIVVAQQETWLPTITAAAAASASYGSLALTEFRGFRDFGYIGGYGMLLCWTATYLALPPILVVMERMFRLESDRPGPLAFLRRLRQDGVPFGRPFAWLAPRAPTFVAIAGVFVALAGTVELVRYVRADPMEYDLANLRNEMKAQAEERHNKELADQITGFVGADGMAILVERPEQVAPLRAALEARRDAAPADKKPFDSLHALQDLVPKDQAKKIPELLAIKAKIVRARQKHVIDDAAWAKVERVLPPDDLAPFGMSDLPADVARPFTEVDGTRGRIVFISPSGDTDDAHYVLRWAESFRETALPDGSVVIGSGRAVIYADMWNAVIDAVPPSVLFSFLAVAAVVLVAFRGGRAAFYVLGALLVGVAWLSTAFVLLGIKLNFLNFIALPITFGIGVDYAVNIVERARHEGAGGAVVALRETGGAVILCSLTTTLGYLALVRSMNHGVRSLGVAAVIGEVSCLLAAVVVLPAALLALEKRAQRR